MGLFLPLSGSRQGRGRVAKGGGGVKPLCFPDAAMGSLLPLGRRAGSGPGLAPAGPDGGPAVLLLRGRGARAPPGAQDGGGAELGPRLVSVPLSSDGRDRRRRSAL